VKCKIPQKVFLKIFLNFFVKFLTRAFFFWYYRKAADFDGWFSGNITVKRLSILPKSNKKRRCKPRFSAAMGAKAFY
jgi:hypothetical protein